MRTISNLLTVCIFCLLATFAGAALAQEPDPCEDDIGAAFGLCNAYCEATECDCYSDPDCEPRADAVACEHIYTNYAFITGNPLTCGEVCPCLDVNGWPSSFGGNIWIGLATGEQEANACIESGPNISLIFQPQFPNIGPLQRATVVGNKCTMFFSQPVVDEEFEFSLTAAEAELCGDLLRAQVVAQGLICD